jgi:hypothetical protein
MGPFERHADILAVVLQPALVDAPRTFVTLIELTRPQIFIGLLPSLRRTGA